MKCITVMDLQGNVYEPTYPKRAKGLVKKGRARFVDENTICLTCLPGEREETVMMSNSETKAPMNLTAAQIFEELKQIREDTSHITLAMEKLEKVPTTSENEACLEKIAAIQKIVQEREETNQALIRLYEKMYDDVYYTSEQETDADA
ncbi:hypothetical protein [Ruminococcus sp.]|uniref:hypothetical protein n=1 Tax=Ruminococcus sp. TaxID=41978 RepID=UPI0025E089F1|nr:hypothetical protein [Ruminococcus sp.]